MTHRYIVKNDYIQITTWNDYKPARSVWKEIKGPRGGKIRTYGNKPIPKYIVRVPEHPRTLWEYSIRLFPKGADIGATFCRHKGYGSSIILGGFKNKH